jgi:hypothetical protein
VAQDGAGGDAVRVVDRRQRDSRDLAAVAPLCADSQPSLQAGPWNLAEDTSVSVSAEQIT